MKRQLCLDQISNASGALSPTAAEAYLLAALSDGVIKIHEDGTIWRYFKRGRTNRLLRQQPASAEFKTGAGYLRTYCTERGVRYDAASHRLIWMFYNGPCQLQINHKNGVKFDNRLSNLEAVTPGQNQEHAYRELGRTRLFGEAHGSSKLSESQVLEIDALKGQATLKDVSQQFGVSRHAVFTIWHRKCWKHLFTDSGI